jgi:hypothetical protein
MSNNDPRPGELVHEAKELDAEAARLHATSDATAAAEADEAADQEWKAAEAITSKVEGFTAGEPSE